MTPKPSLFQAEQSQPSQPFLTGEGLHPSNQLGVPPLDLLQQVHVLPVLHAELSKNMCQSPPCPCLPLFSCRTRSHLCWLSIREEVSSKRLQQWFVAKILRGVNIGHTARESGFPTVWQEWPLIKEPKHDPSRLSLATCPSPDYGHFPPCFHCMPGKGPQ